MSPDLATLQSDLAAAILTGAPMATDWIAGDGPGADLRLGVYRNTVLSGFAEALHLSYPVTDRLVGTRFFDQTAVAFARQAPPRQPVLALYGEAFPAFLAGLPTLSDLSYIADVARLEWAVDQAGLASPGFDQASPSAELPTERGPATLSLAPSLRLLKTEFAVSAIWRAIVDGREDDLGELDWQGEPVWLAVHHADDVVVTLLRQAAWELTERLLAGGEIAGDGADPAATAAEFLAASFVRLTFAETQP